MSRRRWKRLLAFGATATVAALLILRLLPELAAGPDERVEPAAEKHVAEMDQTEPPADEKPSHAMALVLPPPPPPPARQVTPVVEAQVPEKPPQPIEKITEPQAPPAKPKPKLQPVIAEADPKIESAPVSAPAPTPAKRAMPKSEPKLMPMETQAIPKSESEPKPVETEAPPARPVLAATTKLEPPPEIRAIPSTTKQSVAPSPAIEAEGRVLLRILEHGSGPEVEIAWPVSALQRRALYRLLETCYGMEVAIMDSRGRLYGADGDAGRPWQPNLDRYSGFVRQPAGRLTRDEQDRIAVIRSVHGLTPGGLRASGNVRLFPRRLDALLLGGLKALIGEDYGEAAAIRAHYRRDGRRVLVDDIRVDGRHVPGRIDLSKAGRSCRRSASS